VTRFPSNPQALVQEKETKMREGMMMMALRGDALWLSWVLNFMALFLPLSILLTVASSQLFQYSDRAYVFYYFMTFFIASMSYGILISSIFSKSRTAAIVGSLFFFMGFFIFIGIEGGAPSRSQILAASLHPAAAFTFGTNAFTEYEGARVGVTRNTWNVSNRYNVTFQDCLNMMIIDAVWMAALSWYLSQVSLGASQKPSVREAFNDSPLAPPHLYRSSPLNSAPTSRGTSSLPRRTGNTCLGPSAAAAAAAALEAARRVLWRG
jgi:hypothetical protein